MHLLLLFLIAKKKCGKYQVHSNIRSMQGGEDGGKDSGTFGSLKKLSLCIDSQDGKALNNKAEMERQLQGCSVDQLR